MNRNFATAIILASALVLMIADAQAKGNDKGGKGFSNSSLRGTYAESFHGWVSGGDADVTGTSLGPQGGVGLLNADGKGNYTGTQTANILYNSNGNPTSPSACGGGNNAHIDAICTYNLSGTYSVNSDGTGTTTATATPVSDSDCRCGPASGFSTTSSFVMQSSRSLSFVGTDLDATVIGHAERQTGDSKGD
jgi:hypothetical protein